MPLFQGKDASHPRKRKRASGVEAGSRAEQQQEEDLGGGSLEVLGDDLGSGSKGQESVKRKRKPNMYYKTHTASVQKAKRNENNVSNKKPFWTILC